MKTQGQRAGRPDGHQLGPRGPRAQRPGPAGSRRAQPPSGSGPRQPGSLLADQMPGEPSGEDGEAGLWGSLRGQEGCGGEQGAGCCCAEAGRCGDTRREFRGASVLLWRCRCDGLRAPGRSPRCLSGAERGGGGGPGSVPRPPPNATSCPRHSPSSQHRTRPPPQCDLHRHEDSAPKPRGAWAEITYAHLKFQFLIALSSTIKLFF